MTRPSPTPTGSAAGPSKDAAARTRTARTGASDHPRLGMTVQDHDRITRALDSDAASLAASLRQQSQTACNLVDTDSSYETGASWVAGETCRDWRRVIATTDANPATLADEQDRSPSTIQAHVRGDCRHSHTSRNPSLSYDAAAGGWHRDHPPGRPADPPAHLADGGSDD